MRSLGCVLREEPLLVEVDPVPVPVPAAPPGGSTSSGTASPKSTLAAPVGTAHAADAAAKAAIVGVGGGPEVDAAPSTPTKPVPKSAPSSKSASAQQQLRRRAISREELYRSVEDLVTHNFGPRLYLEVVHAIDEAARECLSRLVGRAPGCVQLDEAEGGGGAVVVFSAAAPAPPPSAVAPTLSSTSGGGAEDGAASNTAILQSIHDVYVQYTEFLRCVRSVFLHLDRRFVYLPPPPAPAAAVAAASASAFAPSSAAASSASSCANTMGGGGAVPIQGCIQGKVTGGRAIPRGSSSASMAAAAASSSSPSSGQTSTMGLWDVGMACLRRHMTASSTANEEGSSLGMQQQHRTILQTLQSTIVSTLLRHLDSLAIDAPLTRSSVRILTDLGPTCTSGFLVQLVSAAIAYFDAECRRWMDMAGIGGSGDIVGYLRHVDGRLRLVGTMGGYFLAGVGGFSGAGVIDAAMTGTGTGTTTIPAGGGVPSSVVAHAHGVSSAGGSSTHLLPTIVERHLLAPHYTPQHVLHPTSLYPLLDDESRTVPDVRRLYQLGRRVPGGIDRLRDAFGTYGRVRGLGIVRGQGQGGGGPPASSSGGGGGGVAAAAAAKDVKADRLRIVPNLLAFKAHLEDLHVRAFGNDETFARTVKTVLETVLNAGDGDGDDMGGSDHGGDGGKKVAELLAKHVDLRFRNAKAGVMLVASSGTGSAAAVATASSSAAAAQYRGARYAATTTTAGGAPSASSSSSPENESDHFQSTVLSLFRHVHSKDTFEAFYRRDLAKRLLLNRSTSVDAERQFVSRLKAECGGGYTAKMEGMFRDVELSRDVMANYVAYSSSSGSTGVEMDVQVLTTGYWPVYPQHPNLILPSSLAANRSRFESYYGTKYQGRRIAWQHALGNCVVRANFPRIRDSRDLVVSLCQALVLLCFNLDQDQGQSSDAATSMDMDESESKKEEAGLTVLNVMRRTGIEDRGEAERVLQSLSLGRDGTRVLIKMDRDGPPSPGGDGGGGGGDDASNKKKPKPSHPRKQRRSVSDHDLFFFNESFTSNQRRIRITNVQMKETSEERSKTHESVSRDRLYLIDATVVRIMKARKTLDHRGLMGETMAQLKFPASSADIKKRIESLIEREYMERAEGDRSRYNYLA